MSVERASSSCESPLTFRMPRTVLPIDASAGLPACLGEGRAMRQWSAFDGCDTTG